MICAVCNLYASALYRDACERCNTLRLRAAREFVHAAEAVRLMTHSGVRTRRTGRRPAGGRNSLDRALARLGKADSDCVALRMWTAERSTRRPPWFYGDERSNTR